jgi:4-amino-4-deoxy-L-arabinose transferase-like glycosyltransferase
MFDASNGGQIGWLVPFALGGALLALWQWRLDPVRRAFVVLFLGWTAIYGGIFSYAEGIFHSYYTSAMAPAVAALTGVGSVAAMDAVRRDRRWLIAIAGVVVVTLWAQLTIAGRVPSFYGWMRPYTVGVTLGGLALLATIALWPRGAAQRWVTAGAGVMLGGLLLLPASWSVSAASNASLNATLPQAGPQAGTSGGTFGSLAFDDGSAELAAWLQANHTQGTTWDLVVSSSQGGSRLIAQYGLSVMSLGGFLGSDDTISVDGFAELVASGEVRYVQTGGGGPGGGGFRGAIGGAVPGFGATSGPQAVLAAVASGCTEVSDPSLPATYQGSIYDCAGAAEAIAAESAG